MFGQFAEMSQHNSNAMNVILKRTFALNRDLCIY
jgi:hypothetical protein